MWVKTTPDQIEFDEDDKATIELLRGPYNREEVSRVLVEGAPELLRGKEFGNDPGMALGPQPMMLAPMCALGISGIAFGAMKAQNSGRISRQAHEWIDLVLGFDLYPRGAWSAMFTAAHIPLAVAAGIRIEAIEAVRDGREDEVLTEEEKLRARFVRGVYQGTMDEEIWHGVVALEGSEKGVVELTCMVMLLFTHIRAYQAFGIVGDFTVADVDEMLGGFREGTRPPVDIEAYERAWLSMPWPPPEAGYAARGSRH